MKKQTANNFMFNMKTPGQVGLIILSVVGGLVALIVLAALATAFNLITIPWLKFNSQVQLNRDVVTKTYTADNALYNYHWFQQTSEDLKAIQTKIEQAKQAYVDFELSAGPRASWTFEDKTEDARLHSVYQGNLAQYQNVAADYNAHANEVDRSIFQSGLPLFININPF